LPGEDHLVTKVRLEAFSDGVIAIAITLLVLDIKVPDPREPGTLAHRVADHWPQFAAYGVSFATIGIIWINHHAMIRRLASVDHTIMVLNLLVLATIGLLPWSTSLMAAYVRSSSGEHLAAALYAGSFLAMGLAFYGLQRHILRAKRGLLEQPLPDAAIRSILRRGAAGLVPYALAAALAAVSPYATLALCGAIALFYALPSTTADEPG
jgi:uncharacterized membrane protein